MLFLLIAMIVANASGSVDYRRYFETVAVPAAQRRFEMERKIMESGDDDVNSRIVGGHDADHLHFPFLAGLLVSMQDTLNTGLCSGSLISSTQVVTAAHCWVAEDRIGYYVEVVLGSEFVYHGGTRQFSYYVVVHPNSTINPKLLFPIDVAVIFLPQEVTFSSTIKPISLPNAYKSHTFARYASFAAGYGMIHNKPKVVRANQNQYVELDVLPNEMCKRPLIPDHFICTGGNNRGICGGDSGGPLSVKICGEDILIGIVHGYTKDDCEDDESKSMYIRVTEVMDWILAQK